MYYDNISDSNGPKAPAVIDSNPNSLSNRGDSISAHDKKTHLLFLNFIKHHPVSEFMLTGIVVLLRILYQLFEWHRYR